MNRRLIAVTLVMLAGMTLTISGARADYIIIVVNVGDSKEPGSGQGGAMGAAGAGGAFGAIGNPPGAGGAVGALGNPPGAGGAVGALGNPPGAGGAVGALGNPPGAGGAAGALGLRGAMGAAGAMGAGGFPPMGGSGQLGGPPMGASGQLGGPPMGGEGFAGGALGGHVPEKDTKIRAMAVIEMSKVNQWRSLDKKALLEISHTWGTSWVWAHDVELELLRRQEGQKMIPLPTVSQRFKAYHTKLFGTSKPKAIDLYNLADRALQWGLLKEFEETMKELTTADATHPAAVAYAKVKPALDQKISGTNSLKHWEAQKPFQNFRSRTADFHAVLYKAADSEPAVTSRLRHLSDNFRAYYYWHALRGKALAMPKEKLVCVMVPGDGGDFLRQNNILDGQPIVSDSFYSPRHNLVVFSSKRLDLPYKSVSRATEDLWKTFDKEGLIKAGARAKPGVRGDQFAYAQTYALLLRALDEDGERSSVSHSGTRQLLVGAGLVPGNVTMPQWLQFGTGSFMETPHGSPWRSFGAPHWSYLLSFNELKKQGKFGAADKLLRSIVTDDYFKADDDKLTLKTKTSAWAFTYFLMQNHLDELHAYYKELSRLPRDLKVDGDILLDTFARAMKCVDSNNKRDDAKLAVLADRFISYIEGVKLDSEVLPILTKIHKLQGELAADQRQEETRPKQPGGFKLPGFGGLLPGKDR